MIEIPYTPFIMTTEDHTTNILVVHRDGSIDIDWKLMDEYTKSHPIYDPIQETGVEFTVLCMAHALMAVKLERMNIL